MNFSINSNRKSGNGSPADFTGAIGWKTKIKISQFMRVTQTIRRNIHQILFLQFVWPLPWMIHFFEDIRAEVQLRKLKANRDLTYLFHFFPFTSHKMNLCSWHSSFKSDFWPGAHVHESKAWDVVQQDLPGTRTWSKYFILNLELLRKIG